MGFPQAVPALAETPNRLRHGFSVQMVTVTRRTMSPPLLLLLAALWLLLTVALLWRGYVRMVEECRIVEIAYGDA